MFKKLSMVLIATMVMNLTNAQKATSTKSDSKNQGAGFVKHEFGIHGGPSFSFFFNEHPHQSPRNIYRPVYEAGMIGITYQYNFNRMLGLRIETNYEQKGDVWYHTGSWLNSYTYSASYAADRISYLTVPVTLRFSFGQAIRFFANGGLYGSIQLDAQRMMRDRNYVPFTPMYEVAVSESSSITGIYRDVSPADAGAVIGLGVLFPVGNRAALTIEARNNTGFVSVNANTGLYQNRFYNNSTALLLGVSFYPKKRTGVNLKF